MHQSQGYVDGVIRPAFAGVLLKHVALSRVHCDGLQQRLASDAVGYFYSGAFSIGEAAQGADRGLFTWATVKLYYASFYLLRTVLALNGVCLFYDGHRPHFWTTLPGQLPRKGRDNTHKMVMNEFRVSKLAPALLSQQIGLEDPLTWLIARREDANYNLVKFIEPAIPDHFREIDQAGIRRAIRAYVTDSAYTYAFDPDHAILAYPIEILKEVLRQLRAHPSGYDLPSDERRYLASLYLDDQGPLPEAERLLVG